MQHRINVIDAGAYTGPVRGALATLDGLESTDDAALHLALCRLAAGHFEIVRTAVQSAARTGEVSAVSISALPLVVARYVAWTGDLRTAAVAWQQVRAAADLLFDSGSEESASDSWTGTWLRAATAAELQRTATDVGDVTFAAVMHRHARSTGAGNAGGSTRAKHTVPGDNVVNTILDFVHGVLGVEPDATRHRLRIQPRLAAVPALDVRHIRFGDGDLRINATSRATDSGTNYCLAVGQDSGAIPVTLILEPLVPGRVVRTSVDGTVANLAPRPFDEKTTVVPVQLVLDDERRLEIDIER